MKLLACLKKLKGFEKKFKNVYGNEINILDMYSRGEIEDLGEVEIKDICVNFPAKEVTITVLI